MKMKDSKKFYGAITVSERGQIAIPAEARRDFDIKTGDKLLVLGDLEKGIVLAKSTFILRVMEGALETIRKAESMLKETGDTNLKKDDESSQQ